MVVQIQVVERRYMTLEAFYRNSESDSLNEKYLVRVPAIPSLFFY